MLAKASGKYFKSRLTLLEVHACALDVRLDKSWVEFKRLVKISESGVAVFSRSPASMAFSNDSAASV
jgi:hypothetical protein